MIKKSIGDKSIVPVVMFHSVGLEGTGPVLSHLSEPLFNYLSEPLSSFEEKISYMKHVGYNFVFWSDLYAYMSGTGKIKLPAVMLTFDDGYLDNWIYVWPILKKYGAKATIFVNPDFVDPSTIARPNIENVWAGQIKENQLFLPGFLNCEEMRLMQKSGLVDIQSHALTHTWYFSGPRLLGFHGPGNNKYPWMAWNLYPEQKPFYLVQDQSKYVPLGTPIYEYEKALICRRYFPPDEVGEEITSLIDKMSCKDFLRQNTWEKELSEYHDRLMEKYKHKVYYESINDYKKRVFEELHGSKETIEKELDKSVDFVCWPGGAYNTTVLSIAKQVGYKAWTLSSQDQVGFRNRPGADPCQIRRIGCFSKYSLPGGKEYGRAGKYYFISGIQRHKGSLFHKWIGRLLLLIAMLRSRFQCKRGS